jgi:hypothetical protein
MRRAGELITVLDGERSTAHRAADEARKWMARPPLLVQWHIRVAGFARLRSLPELVGNDAQRLDRCDNAIGRRQRPSDAAAGLRIF